MKNPRYTQLLAKMAALHDAKNHDYAEGDNPFSNFEFAAEFAGVTVDQVFDVLIGVKQARLQVLSKADAPNFESLHDTRIDQANYAALKAAYHENDATPTPAAKADSAKVVWATDGFCPEKNCYRPVGHVGPHLCVCCKNNTCGLVDGHDGPCDTSWRHP